jgi:hypothetical protein
MPQVSTGGAELKFHWERLGRIFPFPRPRTSIMPCASWKVLKSECSLRFQDKWETWRLTTKKFHL